MGALLFEGPWSVTRERVNFLFLNVGHFYDHLFVLLFATVAALALTREWGMSYAELIPYATPGFIAFGLCALPAGWLADKWSREGMMVVFFIGIGACSMLAALVDTPLEIGAALLGIGTFAAIYHPVGLAMVVHGRARTGVPLAVNGIFGNMGVASAALIAGILIDGTGWRAAFLWPGAVAVATGVAYALFVRAAPAEAASPRASDDRGARTENGSSGRALLARILAIVLVATALGGLIFQSTTFALPKMLDERMGGLAATASRVGGYAFLVFAVAAFAQLAVGYLVDRHSIRTVFAVVAGAQAAFLALMHQLTGAAALVVAVAFMLAVFGQIPINDVLIGRMTRSEWRSRVYALRYVVTFSVAATAVPLIAWIHGAWGFGVLFAVLAAAAGVILVAVLMLPNTALITGRAVERVAAE